MFSKVKVDYSTKSKELGNDITIPGCYAVYTRKSVFHKWIQQETYADLYIAILDAKKIADYTLPQYFKKLFK